MCARFTVLSDTPIAAAIAGWAIPLSRNNTIWMRWRCAAGIFQRNAVFSRRTSALLHLTICFPRIRWRKRITPRARKIAPIIGQESRFKPLWRQYKSEHPRGLMVDDQLQLARLYYRKVRRFGTL